MKKLLLITAVLLLVACAKNSGNEPNNVEQQFDYHTITLSLTGEISLIETPLSRASSRDIYGVNIFYDKESDGVVDDPYGYGLFDDVTNITVSLANKHKYKFTSTLVVSAKDKLYYNYDPFGKWVSSSDYISVALGNEFVLDGSVMEGLTSGRSTPKATMMNPAPIDWPNTDRYYGESAEYSPSENGSVNIDMKRCSFGLKISVEGLAAGAAIEVSSVLPTIFITQDAPASDNIYTFNDVQGCWANFSAYSVPQQFTIKWQPDVDSPWQTIGTHTIMLKRNVKSELTIKLGAANSTSTIGITKEEAEMTSESDSIELEIASA